MNYRSFIIVVGVNQQRGMCCGASVAVSDHEAHPQLQNGSDVRPVFLDSLRIKDAKTFVDELAALIGKYALVPTQEAAK